MLSHQQTSTDYKSLTVYHTLYPEIFYICILSNLLKNLQRLYILYIGLHTHTHLLEKCKIISNTV